MAAHWNVYFVIIFTASFAGLSSAIRVTIVPSGEVVRRINDDLNLTCKVKPERQEKKYSLAWNLPIKHGSKKSRVTIYKAHNELTVTIHQLQSEDSGTYICEMIESENLKHNVNVTVRAGKEKCGDSFFLCGGGICILRRFACDGMADCPNKADESPEACGENPCAGKFLCDDGRCISKDLCCDHSVDPDCSVLHTVPCCFKYFNKEQTMSSETPVQLHRYSDINFLQSTIYTIVSCAIAFIFITTIMVVAICRIHMRRSVMSFHSQRIRTSSSRRQYRWPWYFSRLQRRENTNSTNHWQGRFQILYPNLENEEALLHGNQPQTQVVPYSCSLSAHGSFIVTYSDPDGVQLVEHLPKPPPYTEASDTATHLCPFTVSDVPPPPYSSVENLSSANGSQGTLSPPEISSAENDQVIVVHMTPVNVPSLRIEE